MKISIVKMLRTDVKLQTSHLWIVALGAVIGLGFLINCVVAPFYLPCVPIDSSELILSASIIAGLGSARQVVLYKFKYLQDLQPTQDEDKNSAENVLKDNLWIPCCGWCLVLGFAVNMLVVPFFQDVRLIDWNFVQDSIAIFLTISGTREVGIYKQIDGTHQKETAAEEEKN